MVRDKITILFVCSSITSKYDHVISDDGCCMTRSWLWGEAAALNPCPGFGAQIKFPKIVEKLELVFRCVAMASKTNRFSDIERLDII